MDGIDSAAKAARPGALAAWWVAIRPRTLVVAAVPVAVGTALAWADGHLINLTVMIAAAAAAILIQIGTNLHNDVGDYERGADAVDRLGPPRVTTLGWLTPSQVRRGVSVVFGLAFAVGGYLAWYGGWPILVAGILSATAGLGYTSGPRPIAYTALGELFVLAFFGVVAVCGSYFLQAFGLAPRVVVVSAMIGLFAAAVLVVNNYRDLDSDRRVGKRTLAVRMGRRFTRWEYTLLVLVPFALLPILVTSASMGVAAVLPGAALPWALLLVQRFWQTPPGPAFNQLLAQTAQLEGLFGLLLVAALMLK